MTLPETTDAKKSASEDAQNEDQSILSPALLSEEDLRLVHALQIAPRVPWAEAARILGEHPMTISRRWDRLRRTGLAWISAHGMANPSLCMSFIEVECELASRDELIDELCAMPEIVSLDVSARNRDLLLTVVTRSVHALTTGLLPRLFAAKGVLRCQSSICTRVFVTGDSWRLTALTAEEQTAFRALAVRRTDSSGPISLPREFSRLLAYDGRASTVELAHATGVHQTTAKRHLVKAMDTGTLTWRCEIAQQTSGFPITAQWFARVPSEHHEAAAAALARFPGVRLIASTTGRTNFFITMWLASIGDVPRIEQLMSAAVPSMMLAESAVALTIVKRAGWILQPDGRCTGKVIPHG